MSNWVSPAVELNDQEYDIVNSAVSEMGVTWEEFTKEALLALAAGPEKQALEAS